MYNTERYRPSYANKRGLPMFLSRASEAAGGNPIAGMAAASAPACPFRAITVRAITGNQLIDRSLRRQAACGPVRTFQELPPPYPGVFLKEHHPPLIVFENVDPFVLYGFACSLCPSGRRADNHYGVALLNHFTWRKLGKIKVLSHSREEVCNLLPPLEITRPRQFVLGAGGYPGAGVIDNVLNKSGNVTCLKSS